MGVGQRMQHGQALSVVTTFECCFCLAQVRRNPLLSHGSAASHHHGSDAGVRKDLEQERMGDASIHDVCCRNTLGQCPDAALGFGCHASGHDAVVDQLARLGEANFSDQSVGVVAVAQDPRGVCQQDEFFGLQGRRQVLQVLQQYMKHETNLQFQAVKLL